MDSYYWLDDNPEREIAASNLGMALNVNIRFQNLKSVDLDQVLTAFVTDMNQPDLLILDQNLEDANRGMFVKGSTVAAFLRETWPKCPIICVTGEDVHNLTNHQRSQYVEVFQASKVSDYYSVISSIAQGFKKINENWPNSGGEVVKLFNAPEIDSEKLITILPTTLKESLNDASSIVELSKWVREILLKRPGFLYDQVWLSTLLGIRYESFEKIEHLFEAALYDGIFSNTSYKRWWKSKALEILFEISNLRGLPYERGRGIESITEADFSKCYFSDEEFPETVAFTDQSSDQKEEPMKLKYTEIHPDFEKLLYFDDIRLMKGE